MNFRNFFSGIILAAAGFVASAQITVDAKNEFYNDVQKWSTRGLIDYVPMLRPFSAQDAEEILVRVIERGSEKDVETAKVYLDELTAGALYGNLDAESSGVWGTKDILFYFINPTGFGNVMLLDDLVAVSYDIGAEIRSSSDFRNHLPQFINYGHDTIQDAANVAGLAAYFEGNNVVSLKKGDFLFQAGVYSAGYGDFLQRGLALNETAYHAGNFSLSFTHPKFSYSQIMSAIGASNSYDGSFGAMPDKFLSMHSAEIRFNDVVTFGYYENMIITKRFDPTYLLPAPFMAVQGITDCNDNLQMGIVLKVKPFKGLLWTTDIFVDDVNFNEDIKFNFDTRNRVAGQTGIVYAPGKLFFDKLDLSYTLVAPYTFSHLQRDENDEIKPGTYNYQDYTNNGISMGSSYYPNSDALRLSVDFNPLHNLKLNFTGLFSRFGNVNESISDDEAMAYILSEWGAYNTSGTIFNHHYHKDLGFLDTAMNNLNLFTQDHFMYTVQAGVNGEYVLPRYGWGKLSLRLGYNFEYIHNKGVDANMFDGYYTDSNGNKYGVKEISDGVYSYNGSGSYTKAQIVQLYKDNWVANFTDCFNNYFTLGLKYSF